MEQILANVGIDSTVFYQFLIVVLMYIIAKKALVEPLQKVLELRFDKTKRAVTQTESLDEKYNELVEQYNFKIKNAHSEVQAKKDAEKKSIEDDLKEKYKSESTVMMSEFEKRNIQELSKIEEEKNKIIGNSKSLSQLLIERITSL